MVRRVLGLMVVCAVVALAGGCDLTQVEHKMTVQLSATMDSGGQFGTETHNGHIKVDGVETDKCDVTATITGRAGTTERAQELAEATKVRIEGDGAKRVVVIDRPATEPGESVGVGLDVKLPVKSSLHLVTHNGAVTAANIEGQVDMETHNGKAAAKGVTGTVKMVTYNGGIECRDIAGDAYVKTHNGGVDVDFADGAPGVCEMSAVSYNGGIDVKAPKGLSAKVVLSTHNGSVKTDLPITVEGEIKRNRLAGTVGEGKGKLQVETHNGSIRLH